MAGLSHAGFVVTALTLQCTWKRIWGLFVSLVWTSKLQGSVTDFIVWYRGIATARAEAEAWAPSVNTNADVYHFRHLGACSGY